MGRHTYASERQDILVGLYTCNVTSGELPTNKEEQKVKGIRKGGCLRQEQSEET